MGWLLIYFKLIKFYQQMKKFKPSEKIHNYSTIFLKFLPNIMWHHLQTQYKHSCYFIQMFLESIALEKISNLLPDVENLLLNLSNSFRLQNHPTLLDIFLEKTTLCFVVMNTKLSSFSQETYKYFKKTQFTIEKFKFYKKIKSTR